MTVHVGLRRGNRQKTGRLPATESPGGNAQQMDSVLLGLTALVVGILCGCTSIGGILLIPALVVFSNLPTHEAMATALFTFVFITILGTWGHWKKGSLDLASCAALCLGGFLGGCPGALLNARFSASFLDMALAVLVLFAGATALMPSGRTLFDVAGKGRAARNWTLLVLGLFVGVMAGLTGVGGPVLSVPFMMALGFAPLFSIASGQPLAVVACASGTIANVFAGTIDYFLGIWVTAVEMFGMWVGLRIAYRVNQRALKMAVAVLCLATGAMYLVR